MLRDVPHEYNCEWGCSCHDIVIASIVSEVSFISIVQSSLEIRDTTGLDRLIHMQVDSLNSLSCPLFVKSQNYL